MTDHKKRAAQNNLHGSIHDHLIEAWTMAEPRPPTRHSFGRGFTSYEPDIQQYLHDFVFRVIQLLIDDGCLQQPTHDDEGKAVQAVNTLHGLTGDINETTAWINRAARLAAAGVDEATLDVLGRISTTHPVTPDDLNKLAQGSIPTPSLPDHEGEPTHVRDQANLYQDLLDHPFFDGWADTDMSVRDWMMQRLNAALPDQPDDWQAKNAEVIDVADVRIGDRVLLKSIEGSLYEVTITSITTTHEVMLRWNDGRIYESSIERAYLFNRPVVHPDPAEHPVIIVRESTVLPKGSEPQKVVFVRPYYRNDIWNGAPETITDWEPADIVVKENQQ